MVTTTTQPNKRHVSWLDYYIKASEELSGPAAVCDGGYGTYDRLAEGYLDDPSKFVKRVEENPLFNFVLLPTVNKGYLNVVHCISAFEDFSNDEVVIIGIHGTRFSSPWKVLEVDRTTRPTRKPSRRSPIDSIPSLRDLQMTKTCSFVQCQSLRIWKLPLNNERNHLAMKPWNYPSMTSVPKPKTDSLILILCWKKRQATSFQEWN